MQTSLVGLGTGNTLSQYCKTFSISVLSTEELYSCFMRNGNSTPTPPERRAGACCLCSLCNALETLLLHFGDGKENKG